MSKTESVFPKVSSEARQHLAELTQLMEEVHTEKVRSAEELAQMLEPLAQSMFSLTETTKQSVQTTATHIDAITGNFLGQLKEASAHWREKMESVEKVLQALYILQKKITQSAETIQEATQALADNTHKTKVALNVGRWVYPILTATLVALLLTGLAFWRMPDYDMLITNQNTLYYKLDELEKKIQPQLQNTKK